MLNTVKRSTTGLISGPGEDRRNKDQTDLHYRDNYAKIKTREYFESLDPTDYKQLDREFISELSV